MNTYKYKNETEKQLTNSKYYQKVPLEPTGQHMIEVNPLKDTNHFLQKIWKIKNIPKGAGC